MAMYESNLYQGIPDEFSTPPRQNQLPEGRSISIIKELSPQEPLVEQMAWLEGKIWDINKRKFVIIEGTTPFMNQAGRDMFFQFATAILSPIVTMSNYRDDTRIIHALVMMMVKKASIHFHLHWKDYEIQRKTQINVITDKLMVLGLSALYKALGAGDRKAATSNISESINTMNRNFQGEGMMNMPSQNKSIISRMFGKK